MTSKTLVFVIALVCGQSNIILGQSGNTDFGLEVYSDNDFYNLLGAITDKYYTNGARVNLSYTKVGSKNTFPDNLLLSYDSDQSKLGAWGVTQNMYTPAVISKDTVSATDYPYSGALFLTHSITSENYFQTVGLISEIQIGVLGPQSLAAETQKLVHKTFGFIPPKGWQTQLRNNPILNYNVTVEPRIFTGKRLNLISSFEVNAGTLMDQIKAGLRIRLGRNESDLDAPQRHTKLYFTASEKIGWVLYNAHLQGGLFYYNGRNSNNYNAEHTLPASEITNFYFESILGAHLEISTVTISYSQIFRTNQTTHTTSLLIGNITLFIQL